MRCSVKSGDFSRVIHEISFPHRLSASPFDTRWIHFRDTLPCVARERSLSPDELRAFLVGCDNSGMSTIVSAALKLILLTLSRKSEITKAPWTEIDLGACMWEIHGERTKNKKAHMIPLSRQAVAILNTIKPDCSDDDPIVPYSPWVFPGRFGEPICDSTLNEAIRAANWFGQKRFTIHDLRRTASTILHEQGWNTDVVEKALNHTMRGIRGVYNRAGYIEQRRGLGRLPRRAQGWRKGRAHR